MANRFPVWHRTKRRMPRQRRRTQFCLQTQKDQKIINNNPKLNAFYLEIMKNIPPIEMGAGFKEKTITAAIAETKKFARNENIGWRLS